MEETRMWKDTSKKKTTTEFNAQPKQERIASIKIKTEMPTK